MEKQLKKQRRRYIAWGCAAALVILLAVMPMAASGGDDTPQAAILSGQVTRQELETQILGGGLLSGEGALSLDIPADVKITEYLVSNGDSVAEGEPIATVDRVSVMNAITQVQETLDYLSDEISAARSDTAPTTVTALASGTVKVICAQEDDLVSDVMLENGALAVLSLDGKMAVQVEADTDLAVDAPVIVTLEDGTQVSGAVKSNIQGKLTVTVEDEDYTPEQTGLRSAVYSQPLECLRLLRHRVPDLRQCWSEGLRRSNTDDADRYRPHRRVSAAGGSASAIRGTDAGAVPALSVRVRHRSL